MNAATHPHDRRFPLVAMTREMGSLGRDVAEGVARRAGGRVMYHEIIEPGANKMRLRKSHVARFLDGRAGIWERLCADRTSVSIYTAEETFGIVRDGANAVIRGWGAAHLLAGVPHVLRVRVCAPKPLRVQRMMERLGTDNREAVENEIDLSEEAHTAITRRHFGIDWREPENYDLVLSTGRLDVGQCVDEIVRLMECREFRATAESLQVLDDLAQQWSMRVEGSA